MNRPVRRRDFIKAASILGSSLAAAPVYAGSFFATDLEYGIGNEFFTISFDRKNGKIDISRKNGTILLAGATTAVNLESGKRLINPANYTYGVASDVFQDELGSGKKLVITSSDREKKSDFRWEISIYDHVPFITFASIYKNVSVKSQFIKSLEPVRVLEGDGGIIHIPGVSKCITNGEMYFDTGNIHEFGTTGGTISNGDFKGIKLSNGPLSSTNETIHSWWNAGFFCGYHEEGVSIGYLENNLCLGNLLIARTAPGQISFLAESSYAPGITLKPGESISSNRVMINIAENPYQVLDLYAGAVGKKNQARVKSILNGWCSWFYTLAQVSEDEVVSNAEFAAKHFKPYGLEYIQIDEGYQRTHGDWEGNKRFPHGMKWLAEKIKFNGFKAGLWISPYVITELTEIFRNHPDWLVKTPDGHLQRVGNWENTEPPPDEYPKRYCLDVTHPEAAKWLYDLINTIVNDWGYEMIKIDFVAWTVFAANRFHDPSVSAAAVYRRGMEIMRKAAGEKCHILECGPGAITVGLIDSMRLEADVYYGFKEAAWNTYFLHDASSASAASKRYYFHKRTWINDVDHVCLDLLDNQQSEAVATLIALSGGNVFSGDRLTQLDTYKLEVLKKIIPSSGEAALPVKLFDDDKPSAFALKIKKPFAEWMVAGFFNTRLNEPLPIEVPMERLWLKPGVTYLAFDFWKQQFLGEISDKLQLTIQPGSVTLVALHEKSGVPQFLSTDRHITQGGVELENVSWNKDSKVLSGVSTGAPSSSYNLFVYVPDKHPWSWGGNARYRDYGSYSLKLVGENLVRMHIRFDDSGTLSWEIKTEEFLS